MTGQANPATRIIHSQPAVSPPLRTVGPPILRGSTILLDSAADLYDDRVVSYGRSGLSTHDALIASLAELEGASSVSLFPSGLAAMTAAMTAVLRAGDEVLVTDAIYKPTRRFCDNVLTRFGVGVRYHPIRLSASELMALTTSATRLIVMESPGSLTMEMQDVPAIASLARERGIVTLADNTWAAGRLFQPLAHGVDIVVQSLTKYVCGHSDVFMGSAATRHEAIGQTLRDAVRDFGWSVSPDDAYQMLRGLRTLPARLDRHGASALQVAAWLAGHPAVMQVLHPALPGAPDHDLWARDYEGAAGLFSIVLHPVPAEAVAAFLDALTLFGLGYSWGGFESLALNGDPQLKSRHHEPQRPGPIIRLNIGLEAPDDLIADLDRALLTLS